jgi:predicted nuclease with TOPRIM domain
MNKKEKINQLRKELVELKEMNKKLHSSILENMNRIDEIEETLNWVDI